MNLISQTTYDYWCRQKTKMAPSGWLSRNAPCCEYRGQSPDKRGRGGLKIDASTEAVTFHCFNCGATASYQRGRTLYPKFLNLLKWLNVDDQTINQLKLESLRISKEIGYEPTKIVRRDVKAVVMPNCDLLINDGSHQKHVDFIASRGFTLDDFPFLVSPDMVYRSRVVLPFIMQNTIVGYSARSINAAEKMRYIMKLTTDYVFGMEWVEDDHEFVIVTEGLFDALSIRGLAVMHDEISDAQAEMICDLQKRVIVVPDLDKTGYGRRKVAASGETYEDGNGLIKTAIDNGWSVAFPDWKFKDVNAAYVEYGSLFVIKHILDSAIDAPTSIKFKQIQKIALTR